MKTKTNLFLALLSVSILSCESANKRNSTYRLDASKPQIEMTENFKTLKLKNVDQMLTLAYEKAEESQKINSSMPYISKNET